MWLFNGDAVTDCYLTMGVTRNIVLKRPFQNTCEIIALVTSVPDRFCITFIPSTV